MTKSYFLASGYAKPEEPGIHAFSFDDDTGTISAIGSHSGVDSPSFLVVHPNREWLYVVSETGQGSHGVMGSVCSFRFERDPFSITPINQVTTRGDWPCHLQFDRSGRWLVATNYGTGDAAILPIHEDGSLGEMTDFVQHEGSGPNTARQERAHAHSSIFTPDNRLLIIADLGIDRLVIYQFDASGGSLKHHASVNTHPGAGPRHMIFHPNSRWLYVANELNSTVTRSEFDASGSTLAERDTLSTLPAGAPENIVADIHLDHAGTRLYVSNRGHNSLAVYDVAGDGSMSLVSIDSCGGNWPRNFALAPGGNFILVANQYSNEVCVLPVLSGRESLGRAVARVAVTGASCIQFV